MGVCPRLDFDNIVSFNCDNIVSFNCLGYNLIFMMLLSFYAIPLLIYDVINGITIIP